MLAPEMPSDRGGPFRSVITWIFDNLCVRPVLSHTAAAVS
jgi:hypothetical protein